MTETDEKNKRVQLIRELVNKMDSLPEDLQKKIRNLVIDYSGGVLDDNCDTTSIIDEYLGMVCSPMTNEFGYNAAYKVWSEEYRECPRQPFLWGWQEGVDWVIKCLNLEIY